MKNSAVLALVACLAMVSVSVSAQTPPADRRIEATVLDTQGLPIIGAQVTATMPASNLRRTATSSTERFSLNGLVPGVYTLRVSASGFQVQDVSVDLTLHHGCRMALGRFQIAAIVGTGDLH